MAHVERYGPGEDARSFDPGDFILAHRHHALAGLISLAQRRRFDGSDAPYAHWSHAAVVVGADGALVEAESMGVVASPIAKYHDDEYHLVRFGPELSSSARSNVVAYARSQVGQAFGYLELAGAGLHLLLGWPFRWMRKNHQICSGLVTRALQRGGMVEQLDPAVTLPADLAKAFDVRP